MGLRVEGDTNIVGNLQLGGVSVGGLTIAEQYIHSANNSQNVGWWYLDGTVRLLSDLHKITFTAPANGKVKISAKMFVSGIDNVSNGAAAFIGIWDEGTNDWVTDAAGRELSDFQFWQTHPSDNAIQEPEYNISGLTPGASYTYQLKLSLIHI